MAEVKGIESVKKSLQALATMRAAAFYELVRAIGAGEDVASPSKIEKVLSDAGRTAADLEAAVELYQVRQQQAGELSQVPVLEAELAGLKEKGKRAWETFEAARVVYEEFMFPIEGRAIEIQAALTKAASTKNELFTNCPYADLKLAVATATAAHSEAVAKLAYMRGQGLQNIVFHIESLKRNTLRAGDDADKIAFVENTRVAHIAEADLLEKTIPALTAARDAAVAAMLAP